MSALVLSLAGAACNGSDGFKRPMAKPGEVLTVVDEETPEVIGGGFTLEDLVVGDDGTLYLAYIRGMDNYRIVAVPEKGKPKVLADNVDRPFPEPFGAWPISLSLNHRTGTLYVADRVNGWVRAIDADGKRRNVMQAGDGRGIRAGSRPLRGLEYVAVDDASGTVYLADNCRVGRVSGKELVIVAGAPDCDRTSPDPAMPAFGEGVPALEGAINDGIAGLAIDTRGPAILIGSIGVETTTIFRVERSGTVSLVASAGPAISPEEFGVELEYAGDLVIQPGTATVFMADPIRRRVRQVTADGEPLPVGRDAGDQTLVGASRLTVDAEGNVYADTSDVGVTVRMLGA